MLQVGARALAGAPLWWLRRDGDGWRCVASTLAEEPPESGSRCEEGEWALVLPGSVAPALLQNVFYAFLLRASSDETWRVQREAVTAHAALRDLGFEGLCISRDGEIIELNQALADLYGYRREEMLGMHMSSLIAPEVLPRVVELVQSGYLGAYETAALRKDGAIIPLEARGKEIVFQGRPARVASFRDLRDSKAAAAALEEARRSAERASHQKTIFLGNISHELRTPMNGVLGIAQLLLQAPLEPRAYELTQQLHTSAADIVDLLDDLLDLARIEEGRLDLRERPFQLRAVLDGVLRALREVHGGVELKVVIDEEAERWWHGDDRRIRQVLLNLLDNAAKYTVAGRIDVHVTAHDQVLSVAVRDTGIGIASQTLPLLFQRFERGDVEAGAYGGSGLGLHISHKLTDRMGGTLTAESVEGVGSTFVLTLPLSTLPSAPATVSTPETPRCDPLVILVAEDDPVSQIVTRRLLQSLGHSVTVVSSGAGVLEAVNIASYDVVLMDVQMPVLGGLDATRALRERGLRLPVVALTAHAMKADLQRCLEAGMNAWLTKPVQLPRLQAVLARVTEESRLAR